MDNQDKTTRSKKNNAGKVGFILSLVIFAVSLTLFIPPVLAIFVFLMLPPIVLCLTILLSLLLCLYGLVKSKDRKSAVAGLLVNIISVVTLFFVFITFTPPGSIPPRLNRYKFKRACPEAAFWIDFDEYHIIDVKSQYTVIINKFGAVSFYTKDEPYQAEIVIKYAENNGWKYHCSFFLNKDDFVKFDSKTLNSNNEEEEILLEVLWSLYQSPIILKDDCTVLVFETDSPLGYPSYAFISNNNGDDSNLVVFYQNPVLPDSYTDYWFDVCNELSDRSSEEMESANEN